MGKIKVSEKVLSRLWQCLREKKLVTDTNEVVQIIYPGRPSADSGPDFHDAVITINGKVVKGDIEIHITSKHWFNHNHHQDPNYSNTVLHLVWKNDPQFSPFSNQGKRIPVISLISLLSSLTRHESFCLPCFPISQRLKRQELLKLLEIAGKARFKNKVDRFSLSLSHQDAGQVLWQGIMRALGYTKNIKPFEELAQKLPLSFLETLPDKSLALKQAYLLGAAGLLPSQRLNLPKFLPPEPEVTKLERVWQTIKIKETMTEKDWHFAGVRPTNFPTRRLVALSYLLHRYRQLGLFQGILKTVREITPETRYTRLENNLIVMSRGYWAYHFDFGLAAKTSSALLGKDKGAEIITNIILPFTNAWADIAGEPRLKETATKLFYHYPKLTDNEITRHMSWQLKLDNQADISLIHQQGLLHIFLTYCRNGSCHDCPIINCP